MDAGYGAGRHGFQLDLNIQLLPPDAVIQVRVAAHDSDLENGGRRRGTYQPLP